MEWPRIKTIVLAILLITNIGLLSFVVQRAYQGRQMQREARENAILFLQNSGIEVDPAVIPERMGLPPQTGSRRRGSPRPCWAEPSRSCPGARRPFGTTMRRDTSSSTGTAP